MDNRAAGCRVPVRGVTSVHRSCLMSMLVFSGEYDEAGFATSLLIPGSDFGARRLGPLLVSSILLLSVCCRNLFAAGKRPPWRVPSLVRVAFAACLPR